MSSDDGLDERSHEPRVDSGNPLLVHPVRTVGAIWVLSRAGYVALGVRFDTRALDYAYQLVDLDLLRHDLGRSLWFSHAQPPLFNLLTGVVLRLPATDVLLAVAYAAIGLALTLAVYATTAALGTRRSIAIGVAAVWAVLPATVLYEAYYFYSLPVAALLAGAALFLVRFIRSGDLSWGWALGACLAGLALVRSTYHLVWLLPVVVGLVLVAPRFASRRRVLLAMAPLLLVVGLYAKNAIVFGSPAASSWLGMNLARVTLEQADERELRDLQDAGVLSAVATIRPFSPVDHYGDVRPRGPRDVPVLARERKHDGRPNLFHGAYVEVSHRYLSDSLRYVRERPGDYAGAIGASTRYLFLPPSDYPFVDRNLARVEHLDRLANVALLQLRPFDDPAALLAPRRGAPGLASMQWVTVLAYGATVAVLPIVARRRMRGSSSQGLAQGATLAFVAYAVATITVANVALELGENNRFRFETDPLVLVSTGVLLDVALRRRPRVG